MSFYKPIDGWSLICSICSGPKKKHSKYCINCGNLINHMRLENKTLTQEELITLVKSQKILYDGSPIKVS